MNISSISSNSYGNSSALNMKNEIRMLEKQKEQLEDQIKKINESDMNDKIKQENIKMLKEQIQQIESLIRQKESEKLTQSMNTAENDSVGSEKSAPKKVMNNSSGDDLSSMTGLIAANSSVSKARIQNGVKNSLESEGDVLKIEIELDAGRGHSGLAVERKRQQLAEKETRGRILEEETADSLKASHENIEASKESDAGQETASETDEAAEAKAEDRSSLDPLSWLLENGENYKKVDTSV